MAARKLGALSISWDAVHARNVKYTLPIDAGLGSSDAKGKLDLQNNAKAAGANAVVNIVSYYKNGSPLSSATEFECHAGSYSAGLSLKGDIVKTADK